MTPDQPILPAFPDPGPEPEPEPGTAKRPTKEMTRDQRLQARTLLAVGFKYTAIQEWFKERKEHLTYKQISYACTTRATPQKRSGRPLILTKNQVDEIIEFISLSKTNRRMAFWRIAIELGWEGVGATAIRSALRRVGYKVPTRLLYRPPLLTVLQRYVALRKPSITEKNRKLRLEFALEHVN